MRGWLVGVIAASLASPVFVVFVWAFGVLLPDRLVGSGAVSFEGIEKRMADAALLDITLQYGWGRGPWEYTGPPLVVEWHVTSVEKCPGTPPGERYERAGGYRAEVEAYTFFGFPRGKTVIGCGGETRLKWEPRF